MRVESMEFKRCCFCLPLRYSLLISGYFKLASSILLMIVTISQIVEMAVSIQKSTISPEYYNYLMMTLSLLGVISVFFSAEIALTIVFIIGGHKKSVKLLRIYNYYSTGILVLTALSFLVFVGYQMNRITPYTGILVATMLLRGFIGAGVLNIGLQAYVILLTRSEIRKLQANRNFRFHNIASEANCTMEEGYIPNGNAVPGLETADQNETEIENEENHVVEKKTNDNYVRLSN